MSKIRFGMGDDCFGVDFFVWAREFFEIRFGMGILRDLFWYGKLPGNLGLGFLPQVLSLQLSPRLQDTTHMVEG